MYSGNDFIFHVFWVYVLAIFVVGCLIRNISLFRSPKADDNWANVLSGVFILMVAASILDFASGDSMMAERIARWMRVVGISVLLSCSVAFVLNYLNRMEQADREAKEANAKLGVMP